MIVKRLGVATGGARGAGAGGGGRWRRRPVLRGEGDWMTPQESSLLVLGQQWEAWAENGARGGGEMLGAGVAAFGGLGGVFHGLKLRPGV